VELHPDYAYVFMTWCLIKGYGTYFSTGKRYLCRSVINGV